ncbi:MAG: hypothetical protein RLZZ370_1718 [Bacteroidota bacterium]|jgi:hypothetical protein
MLLGPIELLQPFGRSVCHGEPVEPRTILRQALDDSRDTLNLSEPNSIIQQLLNRGFQSAPGQELIFKRFGQRHGRIQAA